MPLNELGQDARKKLEETLGYLNFSSGSPDAKFLANLNALFEQVEAQAAADRPAWRILGETLAGSLKQVRGSSDAFRQTDQAEAVVGLVFEDALPAYREYHRDLLFHQTEEGLYQPFFIGRMCEAVLQQGGPWDETDRIVAGAIRHLNDFIGHRPVPALETERKIQPYEHEFVRPIPLWIRDAGAACGPYRELIERALEIIRATDGSILFAAMFELDQLDELAVDPRHYDFDHPINKRPNYLFGQWDMNLLDNAGRCRRFVLQQAALDDILSRVNSGRRLPREELMVEGAAVLAGTMLMGSGVSGSRPDAHDSTMTLAILVRRIAAYRDAFYQDFFDRLPELHAERLRAEMAALHQPLGGARQDFNQRVTRRRAEQLQHVHLASIFARMGNTESARAHARVVPVASARMKCDMGCRIASAKLNVRQGRLQEAAEQMSEAEDTLHRGIECGAIVDPWNMLGFNAQYSLFPALENSVHDHRIDELLDLTGGLFEIYVEIQKEAAAAGNVELRDEVSGRLSALADWWDKFASTEVSSIEGISGSETQQSADHVSAALSAWYEGGTAAGDIAFWREHVAPFKSPKAYALVVESLLDKEDPVAAMALLMQWLADADQIPLVEEHYSFHDLALRWMRDLFTAAKDRAQSPDERRIWIADRWKLACKFLDYLEANAEQYWEVPRFELAEDIKHRHEESSDRDRSDGVYGAAYEDVTYRDSTDDGVEGPIHQGGFEPDDFELTAEADRIMDRMHFLITLSGVWKVAAAAISSGDLPEEDCDDQLASWLKEATRKKKQLSDLLAAVDLYRIPEPSDTHESMLEYDRRLHIQEMLIERIMSTSVEMADAARIVYAAIRREEEVERMEEWEALAAEVLQQILRADPAGVRDVWFDLVNTLQERPLLYVALSKGGDPRQIVESRSIQCMIRRLLVSLPRLGMLHETSELIYTMHDMEVDHPVGPGAITEFDRLFNIGCRAVAECLIESSAKWNRNKKKAERNIDGLLMSRLEEATEAMLQCWLDHSRGVRLSVLEEVSEKRNWEPLKKFIENYGADLFTQRFMNMGNLRAILHHGVDDYLDFLREQPDSEEGQLLLEALDAGFDRDEAVAHLTLIFDAVVDYYPEYVDYNSITTQSDHGEMIYTLLDFLRLRAEYDRIAWNLQPVILVHEALVRAGMETVAENWREAVADRTAEAADDIWRRFERMSRRYGMHLPSIAERLGGRFIRLLEVDQLRALIKPAIDQLLEGGETPACEQLEKHVSKFTQNLGGSGFDLPGWLEAMETEMRRFEGEGKTHELPLDPNLQIPQKHLTLRQARSEVDDMFL